MSATQPPRTITTVLLDTNILLDYYLATRSGHEAARNFIEKTCMREIPLVCAATSLKDFYYLYCLEVKRAMRAAGNQVDDKAAATCSALAWGCVDNIMEIATVASMGPGDAYIASKLRSVHEDFEDDFILATAMRCGVSHIATNDKELRAHSSIAAATCEELSLLVDLVD